MSRKLGGLSWYGTSDVFGVRRVTWSTQDIASGKWPSN